MPKQMEVGGKDKKERDIERGNVVEVNNAEFMQWPSPMMVLHD